jgi:hypothetical protein
MAAVAIAVEGKWKQKKQKGQKQQKSFAVFALFAFVASFVLYHRKVH